LKWSLRPKLKTKKPRGTHEPIPALKLAGDGHGETELEALLAVARPASQHPTLRV
jgi:hypothetical protein